MEEKFIITFSFITYHLERSFLLFTLFNENSKIYHTKKVGKENIIITPQRMYFSYFSRGMDKVVSKAIFFTL